jgi:two-component system chemotaxis sensor kinase CheA
VRNGELRVTRDLVSLSFMAVDQMKVMIERNVEGDVPEVQGMIEAFRNFLSSNIAGYVHEEARPVEADDGERKNSIYRILFRPSQDIFQRGLNPMLLLNELRQLGDTSIKAYTENIPPIDDMDPEKCNVYWDIFLNSDKDMKSVRDAFIFYEGDCELNIECMEDDGEPVAAGVVQTAGAAASGVATMEDASSVRVPAGRLDKLVNLVGELVTVQARLSQISASEVDPQLMSVAEEIEHLTEELRDTTMTMRMVPIGTTFSKFRRMVRDLSLELGKEVTLKTEGAETELDKTVIDRLSDPLMHLIRNSIDHGIEYPEARKSAGKPAKGTVSLSAVHAGPYVLIEVRDDGRGIDVEKIRRKAIEKGLIEEESNLADKEVLGLVLASGFSTAEDLTSVSGRGVGLDVVKRSTEALRGSVDIDSKVGMGTSITLRLPLTLAIIEGLLVEVAGGYFVIPLSSVEECIELVNGDSEAKSGRRLIRIRDEIVPYIKLREQFNLHGEPPPIQQIVIINSSGMRVGITVDSVVGEHQTVIKSLGNVLKNIDNVSGATILGDGTVALIMDTQKIILSAMMERV